MTPPVTQRERVLAALRPTPDGGPPITRLAARVQELRDAGHSIVSDERRDRCVTYRLQVEDARQRVSPVVSGGSGWTTPSLGGLSAGEHHAGPPETTGVPSAYDPWEGVA